MDIILIQIYIFAFGMAIGSFLNVLLYRMPRHLGFSIGRSFCPKCKTQIKFYDNIPLISYLILGGKCRACKAKISIRYPLVELLNALIYLFLFYTYSLSGNFFVYAFISSMLIVIFFIDLEFQIIPDLITLPGMVIGLAVSFLPDGIGIVSSSVGLLIGGGVLYLIAIFGDLIFKKESMGGGDIKMAAMLGAFLGWQKVVLIFFGGAAIGLIVSIIAMIVSSKIRSTRVIPFGPFLAVAAFLSMIYGEKIISFYINNFLLNS
ncbi:MAG: prepilin peptidase [Candidatus Zixiibacteriota bacterium]